MKKRKYVGLMLALGIGSLSFGHSVEAATERGTIYWETVGDDVTVRTGADAHPNLVGHAFGIYIQQDQHTTAGKNLTLETSGQAGDGIRSNPSGDSNWDLAKGSVTIWDNLKIKVSGVSADGINMNGSTKVKIGDNAEISTLYNGEMKFSNGSVADGSHAIRTNFHAEVEIGDGLKASTLGDESNAVYAAQGRSLQKPATNGSHISIGNRATLSTEGKKSNAVAITSNKGSVTIGDQATLTTLGDGSHGVAIYADATDKGDGKNAQAKLGSQAKIYTSGKASYGAYANADQSLISIGENSLIETLGEGSHGIYGVKGKFEIGDGLNLKTTGAKAHGVYISAAASSLDFLGGATIKANGAVNKADYVFGADNYAIYAKAGKINGTASDSKFVVVGDMKAENSGSIDLMMGAGSDFTGIADQTTTGTINLTMKDSSVWNMTGDWNANLTMDGGGHLYFFDNDPDNFMRVEADGTITINGGTVHFGSDIVNEGGKPLQADYLVVKQGIRGDGGFISVTNQGSANTTGSELVPLMNDVIPTIGNPAEFALTNVVELGGYNYVLDQRDDGNGGIEWYLRGVKKPVEPEKETPGPNPPPITNPADAGVNIFSGAYLLSYAEMNTLLQRIGDLRQGESRGNIWARTYGGKFDSNSNSFLRGFDMNYWGLQVGADKKFSRADQKGDWYVGGMFGYSKGNLDYGYGDGSIDSKSIGAYGTYIAKNGFYSDLVLKYNWMKNDFKVLDSAGDRVIGKDINTHGLTASLEVGRRYHFNQKSEVKEGWYVEPQVQLSIGHNSGGSFRASNGLKVDVDSYNSVLGRVGINIGKEIKSGKNPVNAYAKVSYVHEFDGDVNYYLNSSKEDASFGDSWWVYGVGITAQINKKHNLYLDIERASGGKFTQSWAVNGGYRFTW